MPRALPRLYAILDEGVAARAGFQPLDLVDTWLAAGIRLVQLRAKTMASGPMLELAEAMAAMAREAGAAFIVNDRADIAVLASASGVHVGQEDLAPADVRQFIGPFATVGLSTHTAAQVAVAVTQPIDYLAIGPVFATTTKERPDPVVGLEGVRDAVAEASRHGLPVVAIGGLTLDLAPAVLEAGATSVAVVSDLIAPDAGARARAWVRQLA